MPADRLGYLAGIASEIEGMASHPLQSRPTISIIIPCWNDDALVWDLLSDREQDERFEWIVAAVNPGKLLRRLHETGRIHLAPCRQPSRGAQMNAGGRVARGRLFCFHHADSGLSQAHLESLIDVEQDITIAGGAFQRRFDDRHHWMRRWEKVVHRYIEPRVPLFGDQSIFVRAKIFRAMNGFADIPIMEDLEFSKRLKKKGALRLLRPPIWSSPRRFRANGNWRTTGFNALLIASFHVGISPARLHRWYYRHRQRQTPAQRKGRDSRSISAGT